MAKSFFTFLVLSGLLFRVIFPNIQSFCHILEKIKSNNVVSLVDAEETSDEETSEEESSDNKQLKSLEDCLVPYSTTFYFDSLFLQFFHHHSLSFSDHYLEKVSPPPKC
jgi:hypothetical protein